MKLLNLLLFIFVFAMLAACKPTAKVVEIEAGVEGELISDENFQLDYGEKVISGDYIGTITLSNSGKFPVTGLSATPLDDKGALIYSGGTFPGTNGTCSSTISSKEKCTIKVEFKPEHEGSYTFAITLDYNTGISSKQKIITVKGYAGSIAFLKFDDGSDFDFGIFETNQELTRTYTLNNVGGLAAKNVVPTSIDLPFSYKGGTYPGVGGTCGTSILAYSSCTIVIQLQTTAYENALKSFSIDYQNGNGLATLSGSIQALVVSIEADLNILAAGVQDYGSATLEKGVAKKFKLLNKGYLDATSLTFTGSANFVAGTDTCGGTIVKSTYCEFNVVFTPTVAGTLTEDFTISYNSGKQIRTLTLSGKGKGITPAILSYDILNVNDFGKQGVFSEKTLTFNIQNTGDYTATGVAVSGTSSDFIITANSCLSIMFKGSSCAVVVKFLPLTTGMKTGALKIDYNNGSKAVSAIQVLTGEAAALAFLKYQERDIYTQNYEFGQVPVGGSKVVRVLVENVGIADATRVRGPKYLTSALTYHGEFSLSAYGKTLSDYPNCWAIIESGEICKDSGELYYNDDFAPETFVSGNSYPDCTTQPETICKLDKTGANTGVHIFSGLRVDTDFPICGTTIPAGQKCQIIFEYIPTTTESISPILTVNYVNDGISMTDNMSTHVNFMAKTLASLSYKIAGTSISPGGTYTYPSYYNLGEKILAMVTVTNDGDYDAMMTNIDMIDTAHTNFSFNPTYPSSAAPGTDSQGGSVGGCAIGIYLAGHGTCNVFLWFTPTQYGTPLVDALSFNYNDGANDHIDNLNIEGTAVSVGVLKFTPTPTPMNASVSGITLTQVAVQLPGNSVNRSFNVTNVGDANILINDIKFCAGIVNVLATTCTGGIFAEGVIDTSVGTACLNQSVVPGAGCTLDIAYSPQSVHVGNYFSMILTYVSSGFTIHRVAYGILNSADPSVLHFDASGSSGTTAYDYTLREYMEVSPADIAITNQSTNIAATNVTFSIESDPNNVFSIDSSSSTCTSSIATNYSCSVRVNFTPNGIGDFAGVLRANYHNGQTTATTYVNLKGKGEPPRSTHKGWSSIIAVGEKINVSNVSDNNIYNEVAWNDMVPKTGYTITGYNIYRRSGDGHYGGGSSDDYTTPYNTAVISTTTKKFKDTDVTAGKVYYYEVRPIIMGFPSRTLDNMREVRVTTPIPNTVFVHRWMANTLVCQKLGKTPDIYNNARCAYSGLGAKNNFYDMGYDLFVDRYELGADKTSRPGQLPIKATQANALSYCDAEGDVTILNISTSLSSKTVRKRILTRKEFYVASMWNSSETDAAIVTKESGLTSSTNCNGATGSSVENTGNNTLCKSFFGVEDAAGNELEWVSDRIANGIGITDQMNTDVGYELRLDTENKDLAGLDFTALVPTSAPNLMMKDAACFSASLGISLPITPSTGTCNNSKVSSALGATYFHNNIYSVANYGDLKGMASGGAAYISGTSGVLSSYWLSVGTTVGTRCAIKLDY
jgi:hypothetical protein